jgi:hypothetical protein
VTRVPAPVPKKLLSTQNPKSIIGAWLFTFVWCGIAFTVFWAFAFQARDFMGGAVGGLFSLLGLVMLYQSAKMTLEYFKYGRVSLKLEGNPATGSGFGALLELPGDLAGAMTIHAELACMQTTWSRGSKGGPSKSERDVWSRKSVFPVRRSGVGSYAALKFDVPADQPASDLPEERAPDAMVEAGYPAGVEIGRSYYRWEVRVTADVPGVDLDRTYPIRVVQGSGVPAARPSIAAALPRVKPAVSAALEQRIGERKAATNRLGLLCAFVGFAPIVVPFAISGIAIGLAGCPMGWRTGSPPACQFAGINWGPLMAGAFDHAFVLFPAGIAASAVIYFLGQLWLDRRHETNSFGKTGMLLAIAGVGFVVYQAWQFMGPFRSGRPTAAPVQQPQPVARNSGSPVQAPPGAGEVQQLDEERLKKTLATLDGEGAAESPAAGLAHYRLSQQYERQNKIAAHEQALLRALAILEGHPAGEARKALGPDGAWLDKEVVARRLGDFYWDRRNYPRAYEYYDRAYRYVSEVQVSDTERNLRLARNSAGRMVGACTQGDWAVADEAMRELKERIVKVDEATRKQLEYWIRTGEQRLAARQC